MAKHRTKIRKPGKIAHGTVGGTPLGQLMTTRELARFLNVSKSIVDKWRGLGEGPRFVKVGSRIRYAPDDVQAYVKAATKCSTSETRRRDPAATAEEAPAA